MGTRWSNAVRLRFKRVGVEGGQIVFDIQLMQPLEVVEHESCFLDVFSGMVAPQMSLVRGFILLRALFLWPKAQPIANQPHSWIP